MYLHPLIHSELIRQRQRRLSRLPLRGDRGSRLLPGKKTAATLGALLVATVAALALTSGAFAATAKKQPHGGTTAKAASWKVVQDATGKITIRIGGRVVYVYYPAPSQPLISSNTDANDDCVNYQVNCTDEQNCQHWGINCDLVNNKTNDTQVAQQDGSVSDSSSDGSGQAANTGPEPLPDVASDSSASQLANDTTVNLVDPSLYEVC